MTKVLIIEPNETVLKSLIRDGFTLLTQLIFLYVSIVTEQTAWSIFAFIMLTIFVSMSIHKHLKTNRFNSFDSAIKYLKNRRHC